jgi:hypothetical protein
MFCCVFLRRRVTRFHTRSCFVGGLMYVHGLVLGRWLGKNKITNHHLFSRPPPPPPKKTCPRRALIPRPHALLQVCAGACGCSGVREWRAGGVFDRSSNHQPPPPPPSPNPDTPTSNVHKTRALNQAELLGLVLALMKRARNRGGVCLDPPPVLDPTTVGVPHGNQNNVELNVVKNELIWV